MRQEEKSCKKKLPAPGTRLVSKNRAPHFRTARGQAGRYAFHARTPGREREKYEIAKQDPLRKRTPSISTPADGAEPVSGHRDASNQVPALHPPTGMRSGARAGHPATRAGWGGPERLLRATSYLLRARKQRAPAGGPQQPPPAALVPAAAAAGLRAARVHSSSRGSGTGGYRVAPGR